MIQDDQPCSDFEQQKPGTTRRREMPSYAFRPVSPINYEPYEPPASEIISLSRRPTTSHAFSSLPPSSFSSSALHKNEVHDDDSDASLSDTTRAAKRRKIENIARRYLATGKTPVILSAGLKGPLEKGWANPWKNARKDGRENEGRKKKKGDGYGTVRTVAETHSGLRRRRVDMLEQQQAEKDKEKVGRWLEGQDDGGRGIASASRAGEVNVNGGGKARARPLIEEKLAFPTTKPSAVAENEWLKSNTRILKQKVQDEGRGDSPTPGERFSRRMRHGGIEAPMRKMARVVEGEKGPENLGRSSPSASSMPSGPSAVVTPGKDMKGKLMGSNLPNHGVPTPKLTLPERIEELCSEEAEHDRLREMARSKSRRDNGEDEQPRTAENRNPSSSIPALQPVPELLQDVRRNTAAAAATSLTTTDEAAPARKATTPPALSPPLSHSHPVSVQPTSHKSPVTTERQQNDASNKTSEAVFNMALENSRRSLHFVPPSTHLPEFEYRPVAPKMPSFDIPVARMSSSGSGQGVPEVVNLGPGRTEISSSAKVRTPHSRASVGESGSPDQETGHSNDVGSSVARDGIQEAGEAVTMGAVARNQDQARQDGGQAMPNDISIEAPQQFDDQLQFSTSQGRREPLKAITEAEVNSHASKTAESSSTNPPIQPPTTQYTHDLSSRLPTFNNKNNSTAVSMPSAQQPEHVPNQDSTNVLETDSLQQHKHAATSDSFLAFDTQALIANAQRSLDQSLDSPEKYTSSPARRVQNEDYPQKPTSSPSGTHKSAQGNASSPPTTRKTNIPTTTPRSAFQPLSTQALLDAATPFAFSTIKRLPPASKVNTTTSGKAKPNKRTSFAAVSPLDAKALHTSPGGTRGTDRDREKKFGYSKLSGLDMDTSPESSFEAASKSRGLKKALNGKSILAPPLAPPPAPSQPQPPPASSSSFSQNPQNQATNTAPAATSHPSSTPLPLLGSTAQTFTSTNQQDGQIVCRPPLVIHGSGMPDLDPLEPAMGISQEDGDLDAMVEDVGGFLESWDVESEVRKSRSEIEGLRNGGSGVGGAGGGAGGGGNEGRGNEGGNGFKGRGTGIMSGS